MIAKPKTSSLTLLAILITKSLRMAPPSLRHIARQKLPIKQKVKFMSGVRFTLLGYPQSEQINGIINFLTQSGGATHIHPDNLTPDNIDLFVISGGYLDKVNTQVENILECRMNPGVMFVRGKDYLEHCCKHRSFLPPPNHSILFPNGGIIVLTKQILLESDDILLQLDALIKQEEEQGREWIIKIHKKDVDGLKLDNSIRGRNAGKLLEEYISNSEKNIKLVSEEEESKSNNISLPSIIRSAAKMSFVHIYKFRHVVLLTNSESLAKLAKSQKLLCMNMEKLVSFFEEQKKAYSERKPFRFSSPQKRPQPTAKSPTTPHRTQFVRPSTFHKPPILSPKTMHKSTVNNTNFKNNTKQNGNVKKPNPKKTKVTPSTSSSGGKDLDMILNKHNVNVTEPIEFQYTFSSDTNNHNNGTHNNHNKKNKNKNKTNTNNTNANNTNNTNTNNNHHKDFHLNYSLFTNSSVDGNTENINTDLNNNKQTETDNVNTTKDFYYNYNVYNNKTRDSNNENNKNGNNTFHKPPIIKKKRGNNKKIKTEENRNDNENNNSNNNLIFKTTALTSPFTKPVGGEPSVNTSLDLIDLLNESISSPNPINSNFLPNTFL